MIVLLAPEVTAAPVADVLVHDSRAFFVNIVTMTPVVWDQDIARSLWEATGVAGKKNASRVELGGQTIHARSLPNIKISRIT